MDGTAKRRQSGHSRHRIFEAAASVVDEIGYRRATIEGVAKHAGAGKQTIYRWWKNKTALFLDVYMSLIDFEESTPIAGSVEEQLTTRLSRVFKIYRQSPAGKILCGLLSDAQDDQDAADILTEGLVLGRRYFLIDPLRQAVEAGQLRPSIDVDRVYDTIVARVWHALLTEPDRLTDAFASALVAETLGLNTGMPRAISPASSTINRGYRPGVVGDLVALHGRYYAREWNFDHRFETLVATEVAAFFNNYDPKRDLFLSIEAPDGTVAASISIMTGSITDRQSDHEAWIRWFIVDPSMAGRGYGRTLLEEALAFCDENRIARVKLKTFEGLDAARHLYDAAGFSLVEVFDSDHWNMGVREVQLERRLPG